MNLIDNIKGFKNQYKCEWYWFKHNQCSMEVLEYYINNYKYIEWSEISKEQLLTESFINKYADKINWNDLFLNTKLKLKREFIEKHIYQFNLYYVIHENNTYVSSYENGEFLIKNVNDNRYNSIFDKLKNKYPEKYQIDKLQWNLKSFT